MKSGLKYEGLISTLTLRITRDIMSAICAVFGYQRMRLQLTILFHVAAHRSYDLYSPTWPSAVARAMKPKGQLPLSLKR
jgi:hypothetical protein